jgi:pyrroloquinoline-quinone synthase
MPKSPFRLALEESVNQRHSVVHPWSEAWQSGKLDRRMLGEWVKQHYHYVSHFSEWLALVYGSCPEPEVQHFLLENVAEEEGLLGMGEFGAVRHTDLLLDFAGHCGVGRAEIVDAQLNGEVLAETLGLQCWCHQQARRPFVEALAGLIIGLEAQVPVIYRRTTPSLIEKYGFTPDEITFFRLHIVADDDHGERGYEIVEKYATTEETRATCVRTVKEAAAMRRLLLDGVYRRCFGAAQPEGRKAA